MSIENNKILIETLKSLKIIFNYEKNFSQINLEDVSRVTPFFITPLSAYIGKNNLNSKIISPKNVNVNSYLNTLKFPFGFSSLNNTNICKKTYCPLFEIKTEHLGDNNEILNIFKKIIIEPFKQKKNLQAFLFFLDEIMCNIQEHSRSSFNLIQAQKYNNILSISIVDTGISIPKSYENNFRYFEDDIEALKFVFKGISTKNQERGTGIPNTYRLITKGFGGTLLIISREAGVLLNKDEINFFSLKDLNLSFQGTILNFEIPLIENKLDIYDYINKN